MAKPYARVHSGHLNVNAICVFAGVSRLHAPTTSSNHCGHSPIYSKLLDDSMSSYDDAQAPPSHSSAPPPGHAHPPQAPPTPRPPSGPWGYELPDHIPRLHEAHPYWVLEHQANHHSTAPVTHHHLHRPHPAASVAARLDASRPVPPTCWRPLPLHGTTYVTLRTDLLTYSCSYQ